MDSHLRGPCNILVGQDPASLLSVVVADGCTDEVVNATARLLTAAYNSFNKHFGDGAVKAAEGDVLGELIQFRREQQARYDLMRADLSVLEELHDLLDLVQNTGAIHDLDQQDPESMSTLASTLYAVLSSLQDCREQLIASMKVFQEEAGKLSRELEKSADNEFSDLLAGVAEKLRSQADQAGEAVFEWGSHANANR